MCSLQTRSLQRSLSLCSSSYRVTIEQQTAARAAQAACCEMKEAHVYNAVDGMPATLTHHHASQCFSASNQSSSSLALAWALAGFIRPSARTWHACANVTSATFRLAHEPGLPRGFRGTSAKLPRQIAAAITAASHR